MGLIAKSNVILDVKPWDDETDLVAMEAEIRKIECEGLLWGKAEKKPVAFGVFKLVISAVVEDLKVSVIGWRNRLPIWRITSSRSTSPLSRRSKMSNEESIFCLISKSSLVVSSFRIDFCYHVLLLFILRK